MGVYEPLRQTFRPNYNISDGKEIPQAVLDALTTNQTHNQYTIASVHPAFHAPFVTHVQYIYAYTCGT